MFLQFEFAAFAAKTEDAKVVDTLKKTWLKMSPRPARRRAVSTTGRAKKSCWTGPWPDDFIQETGGSVRLVG